MSDEYHKTTLRPGNHPSPQGQTNWDRLLPGAPKFVLVYLSHVSRHRLELGILTLPLESTLDVLAGSIVEPSTAPLYKTRHRLTTVNLQPSSQASRRTVPVPKTDSCAAAHPGTTGTTLQVYQVQSAWRIRPAIRLAAILLAVMFQTLTTLATRHECNFAKEIIRLFNKLGFANDRPGCDGVHFQC